MSVTRRSSETTSGPLGVIGTKLVPPKPAMRLVNRPHLLEMLDRCRDGCVTLISAPAGYGKTTLVSQWLEANRSIPAAWLSLDRPDNDLERFARYVAAALTRIEEGRLSQTEAMLSARNLPTPHVLAESMILGLDGLRSRTVLVLDDYGLIRSPVVHEFMDTLVSKLPSNLHLVIMTRVDPPLPTSLWRSRGWLHELRAADLRCSRGETAAFFHIAEQLELSEGGIDTIHRKTEGWITGLRLALLSLEGSTDPEAQVEAFSASDRLLTDYLVEEALARQPPEIRQFLGLTSVLERFNPELCDELLAGSGPGSVGQSRGLLDRLYRKNLFVVPLDPTHGWYRYHHLFRQLLLERFEELTPTRSKEDTLRRAGGWFCARGLTEEGLACLLAAGDLDAAEEVIGNRLHAVMADDLSRRTLARWLELFPPDAKRERIPLIVAESYLKTLRSDYDGVEHNLDTIDDLCRSAPCKRQTRWLGELRFDLELLRAITLFWNGDVEGSCEHASRILGRGSDASEFVVSMAILYYGGALALTGRSAEYVRFVDDAPGVSGPASGSHRLPFTVVRAAIHLYRGALADCQAVAAHLTSSPDFAIPKYFETIGYYLLGVVAYERNQIDEAERHFQAVESRRLEAPAFLDHAAAAGLAQIELARGNLDAAEQRAKTARSIAVEVDSSFLLRATEAVERYLAVATGNRRDGSASRPPGTDFAHWSIIQPSQSWAWSQIQSSSSETAGAVLEFVDEALDRAEAHGVTRRAVQLSALRALALDALSRRDEAITVLEAALRRGVPLGLVRSFVDFGEGVRKLLRAVAARHPGDEEVAAILRAFETEGLSGRSATSAYGNGAPSDMLTNRELDVLELLQRRMTNKEIGARLGIAGATVKMHTLGIYRKLGVRGRRQAVSVSIERGILSG